jgi:hypothetical protein
MQVERGKTRPQTLMTGHTGYITHARKVIKLSAPELQSEPQTEPDQKLANEQADEETQSEQAENTE